MERYGLFLLRDLSSPPILYAVSDSEMGLLELAARFTDSGIAHAVIQPVPEYYRECDCVTHRLLGMLLQEMLAVAEDRSPRPFSEHIAAHPEDVVAAQLGGDHVWN